MNTTINILYRDKDIVVAVKPVGILSQSDKTGEPSMIEILCEQLKKEIFSIHRLDRAVGGVMVFAFTRTAAGKLSGMMGTDRFIKEYLAVVHGTPQNEKGMLCDYLLHDPKRNITTVVSKNDRNAKEALLSYDLLQTTEENDSSLVHIHLHTGRTHQIRVQFSSRNMPIVGDGKYGSRDRCGLALWSNRLSFSHPTRKKHLTFSALPDLTITPWDRFSLEQ